MKPDRRPMLATLTDKPFDDPDWIFETKWDGFRLMAEIKDGSVALFSRNLIDLSRKYPSVCAALSGLRRFAVIDGELVALDARGRSRFQLLQNAEREKVRLRYCVFDLIYLDDQDLQRLDAWAREHGWTKSQAVRVAIRALTRRPVEDPLLELSGDLDGLPEDLSENFDRYLNETFVAAPSAPYRARRRRSRAPVRR